MDRVVRQAWRQSTYRLLNIREVQEGESFVAEDVISGELLSVPEGTATQDNLVRGDWLLGVMFEVDGQPLMEGTAELLAPAGVAPVYAVLSALGGADGHAAAWAALTALHEAYAASPDGSAANTLNLPGRSI
jgi:hypothetical protein